MRMSKSLPAKILAGLAVGSGVAAGLPTASIARARAQAQKGQAEPPKEAVKAVTIEVAPAQKAEVAPARQPLIVAPQPLVVEKAAAKMFVFPPPPVAAPAGAAANLEPMIQQITQQLRPAFRAELRFLSSASEPSPAQRREIAFEGARAVKDAATRLATIQNALQHGGWNGGAIPDGRKLIRDGLTEAARSRLSPEQFARYQQEVDARARDQREVIALNLVANLDRLLFLSHDQREKIRDALLTHWDDRTFPTLENLANYEAYFPVLPDRHIAPLLNQAQRNTWNGAQKVNFGQSFNFFNNNNRAVDPADADEDEKAAMAEVEKKK